MVKKAFIDPSPAFYLLLALMLLVLPLKWLFAAAIAALYHELCHVAAIRLCHGDIHRLSLSANGARLDITELSIFQELICALAGPIGGLCLLFFAKWIPRIAVCAAFQSLYNLLPIYPLDGGRALWCAISLIIPADKTARCCKVIESICFAAILLTAFYSMVFLKLGVSSLFPAILIITHTKFRKTPCKQRLHRLQ